MKRWKAIAVASTAALAVSVALFASPTSPASAGVTFDWDMLLDCDASTGAIEAPPCVYSSGTSSVVVAVKLRNNTGASADVGTFQFEVVTDEKPTFTPPTQGDANLDGNPDFTVSPAGTWTCNPPGPSADLDSAGDPANRARSRLVCFSGSTAVGAGATIEIARVTYTVNSDGVGSFSIANGAVTDTFFVELMSCNDVIDIEGGCIGTSIQVGTSSETATAVPTDTPTVVGTATPVPTGTSLAFVTVTLTASATVPATAPPGGGETPGAAPTQPGGQIPPGEGPGGAPGGGGQGPITLPDTGTGSNDTSPWSTLLAFGGLAIALGGVAGGIYFRKLRAQTARNED